MKILILGAKKNKFNLENSYLRAFNNKGIKCSILDIHKYKNFHQKIIDHHKFHNTVNFPILRKIISENFNKEILSFVKKNKPSVCFFFSLNYMFPEPINQIKKYSKVISFLSDDFIFNKVFLRNEILDSLKEMDINFCLGEKTKKYLSKFTDSYYLPFGWDNIISKKNKNYNVRKKITFCGYYDDKRFQILKNINNLDYLSVYGSKNWSKLKSFSNKVEIKGPLNYGTYINISRNSLINLNLIRNQNLYVQGLNMRTFELGGEKCFFLQNYSSEMNNLFESNFNEILFKDNISLNNKISFYIRNNLKRKKITNRIYKIISSNHKYLDRVNLIINILK